MISTMRFFKCAVIAFAALEAILVNAACRDTDIYVIDAIIRGKLLAERLESY